jgi:hypothetical protein
MLFLYATIGFALCFFGGYGLMNLVLDIAEKERHDKAEKIRRDRKELDKLMEQSSARSVPALSYYPAQE